MTNLRRSTAKVFKLGLQNSHVKCVKLKDKDAATEYAKAVEEKRKNFGNKVSKTDADYLKKFETSINTGLEAAQKNLLQL